MELPLNRPVVGYKVITFLSSVLESAAREMSTDRTKVSAITPTWWLASAQDEHHQQVKHGIVEDINPGHRFTDRRQHGLFPLAVLFKLHGVSGDHQQDDQDINLRSVRMNALRSALNRAKKKWRS